jgi:hypothetical protein
LESLPAAFSNHWKIFMLSAGTADNEGTTSKFQLPTFGNTGKRILTQRRKDAKVRKEGTLNILFINSAILCIFAPLR